jgi:cytochrome oxidase Cu insertion factor (SCO1/SenC/PrrC family)
MGVHMKRFRNHGLPRVIFATFLAVGLVEVCSGGSLLHAASVQTSITALGLTAIAEDVDAPAFRLSDLDGKMVSLQENQGKVVMLYFWTTW